MDKDRLIGFLLSEAHALSARVAELERRKNDLLEVNASLGGRTPVQSATPDKVEVCLPARCACGHCFTEAGLGHCENRQVFDIPAPKLEVTEYRIFRGKCPRCGAPARGESPEGVNAPVQYGGNIKSLCVPLSVHYRIPHKKISELMRGLYGHQVNESTIAGATGQCYRLLSQTEERMEQQQTILDRYEKACRDAIQSEPQPQYMPGKRGRPKRTKGRNFAERLLGRKSAVLAFAFNEGVPFTNNLAERDLRAAKVRQKVSNCFRTFRGAEVYARIEGFISTVIKNDMNVFEQLRLSFNGKNFIMETEAPK